MEKKEEFGRGCFEHESTGEKPKSRGDYGSQFLFFLRVFFIYYLRERESMLKGERQRVRILKQTP